MPLAIQISVFMILLVYLLSAMLCLSKFSGGPTLTKLTGVSVLSFTLVCFGIWSLGFFHKQTWLGAEIYFVPSDSMMPTLNPGEFILVDTWTNRTQSPVTDDVVVLRYEPEKEWLVKRISTWPDGNLINSGQYYVLGDNSATSRDSRFFGGISESEIVGKVRLVLLGIDHKQRIMKSSLLREVR